MIQAEKQLTKMKQSMKNKTPLGIFLILIAALFVAVGQLFWKISRAQINSWLIIGFFIYAVGALIMTVALRLGKLSTLQPIFSFSYIAAIFLGNIFLNEKITIQHLAAIVLIMLGIICLSKGEKQ